MVMCACSSSKRARGGGDWQWRAEVIRKQLLQEREWVKQTSGRGSWGWTNKPSVVKFRAEGYDGQRAVFVASLLPLNVGKPWIDCVQWLAWAGEFQGNVTAAHLGKDRYLPIGSNGQHKDRASSPLQQPASPVPSQAAPKD